MKKTKIRSIMINQHDQNSCVVSDPLKIVYQFTQITSTTPATFTRRHGKWYMSISHTLTRVHFIVIFLLNISFVIALVIDFSVGPQKSTRTHTSIRTLVWITQAIMTVIYLNTCTYHGPARTRVIINCLNKLREINRLLSKPESTRTSTECFLLRTGFCFVTILCAFNYYIFIMSCIMNDRDLYSAGFYVAYYYIGYLTQILKVAFIYTVLEGYKSLKLLNDRFENIACWKVSHGDKPVFTLHSVNQYISNMDVKSISSFVFMYDVVMKVVKDIERAFEYEILLAVITNLIELVLTPYNLIVNIKGEMHLPLLVMQSVWTVCHIVTIVFVVEPCHRTRTEMDRTNILVSRIISCTADQSISGPLEKFILYLNLNKVCYCPLGMFTISRSMLASIAGSVTTYLVILVQFQGQDAGEY